MKLLRKTIVLGMALIVAFSVFGLNASASGYVSTRSKYYYSYYSNYIVYGKGNSNGSQTLIAVRSNSGCPEEFKINFELKVNLIASLEAQLTNAANAEETAKIVSLALAYTGNPAAFATFLATLGYSTTVRNIGSQLLQARRDADVYFYRLEQYKSTSYSPGCSISGNTWICPYSVHEIEI